MIAAKANDVVCCQLGNSTVFRKFELPEICTRVSFIDSTACTDSKLHAHRLSSRDGCIVWCKMVHWKCLTCFQWMDFIVWTSFWVKQFGVGLNTPWDTGRLIGIYWSRLSMNQFGAKLDTPWSTGRPFVNQLWKRSCSIRWRSVVWVVEERRLVRDRQI